MADQQGKGLDTSDYLKLFLEEAEDQLDGLEQGLVKLESGEGDTELVSELFRASHTLKGASATMGFEELTELTHLLENVFQQVRDEGAVLDSEGISVALDSVDVLRALKDAAAVGEAAPSEWRFTGDGLRRLVTRLQEVPASPVQSTPATSSTDFDKALFEEAESRGAVVFALRVTLHADCQIKSARVALVFRAVERFGEILAARPDVEALDEEDFDTQFTLFMATTSAPEEVAAAAAQVFEVDNVQFLPWREELQSSPASQDEPQGDRRSDSKLAPDGLNRRVMDLGPEARGKPGPELLTMTARKVSGSVRVDTERLDRLATLAGELVVLRSQFSRLGAQPQAAFSDGGRELQQASRELDRMVTDLQTEVLATRMLPITAVFERLPRLVRDLARDSNKLVTLTLLGKETELDRSIIERLGDPLVHLLRNSVDHGLETEEIRRASGKQPAGQISVSARHHEGHVVIEVKDDGAGIDTTRLKAKALERGLFSPEAAARLTDTEAVSLIFASGLSIKDQVSQISGRGVGMDIVKHNVEQMNGTVEVTTRQGQGTTFVLRFPLTLAVLDVLLTRVGDLVCGVPVHSVVETLRLSQSSQVSLQGRPAMYLRGEVIPLYDLRHLTLHSNEGEGYVAVLSHRDRKVGLQVDELLGRDEIVIKPLPGYFQQAALFSGSCILGDGSVSLVVDAEELYRLASTGELEASLAEEAHQFA